MPATECALRGEAPLNASQVAAGNDLDIVLKPLSRPELGEIRVDGMLAVGRAEQPFATYQDDIVVMLSRRHARIFCEAGSVYVVDLESSNGTTVNRIVLEQTPQQLHDGDEIGFGGVLSYRVQIAPRAQKTRPAGSLTLTLTPESVHSGLDTIVITRFPFLVSKADALFSGHQEAHARQVSYLSRRQAHIFQKGSDVCIEDLASTNGTFVDGLRLQEHAVPLQDGVLVAFGGDHFTYRVGITREPCTEPAPAATRTMPNNPPQASEPAARQPGASEKTTFIVAPTSFLDIFCVDQASSDTESPSGAIVPVAAATADNEHAAKRRPRGRVLLLLSELSTLVTNDEPADSRRGAWKAAALVAVLGAIALTAMLWGADERQLKNVVERGDYAQASVLVNRLLEQRPGDVDLKALATEAALKANVPPWLAKLQMRDFDGAQAALGALSELGVRNPDLHPIVAELAWLGNFERLVSTRGGPEAPIRIYADEDGIETLLAHWNDNTSEHQRTLARVAAHVPQFSGPYGEMLTHLRKLQSEAMVYLAAIDRLKAAIATELGRDNPEALVPVLQETAEKYPHLGGLDGVRGDLARYIEIRREARGRPSGQSGRLFALQLKARFTTPPFQQSYRTLATSGQLAPADLVRQYEAATQAWKDGQASQALAGLQKMAVGPWAEAAAKALERKQTVMARFGSLQQARASSTTSGYVEQLLAFRESLDADEDVYFARATQADLEQHKDQVMARAQDNLNRARTLWQEYRNTGPIEASQRIETTISSLFRTRARLLSEASRYANQSTQVYAQVDAAGAERWTAIRDEIKAEAKAQRSALQDLRNVLEPELLKSKLALLGDASP
ncbi:FHA domain-containing protein [Polaromonas hydrogenivorans]|uniref:FHA domain-containing protein n=1 Tax=Polaromonas hydrogenivorans TaxID=335476 RepID=A0AAU7LZ19_9BURK